MSPGKIPKTGDVWWVGFGPAVGGEIKKTRPALSLSNDHANAHLNRVQVVPLTSNVGRLYPSEAYVRLQDQARKALADQIATVSKQRLRNFIGRIDAADLKLVEQAVLTQLGLR